MSAGDYTSMINPGMALILSAAFFLLWRHQRQHRYIGLLGASFLAFAAAFVLQHFLLFGFTASKFLSNVLYLTGGLSLAAGILDRYGRLQALMPMALCAVAAISAYLWFLFVQIDVNWRLYAINFALGAMCLMLAAEMRAVRARKPIDNVLLGILLLCSLNFFLRPLAAIWLEGPYESYESFHSSLYWVTMIVSAALFMLLLALTLIVAAALDVIEDLRHESQTDPLSRLLNRRGFEEGSVALLNQARRKHMPVTLVVCDLDHFKAINDGYGHGCGDGVIVAFADCLRQCVSAGHLVGRIGGEEFAILLLGADIGAGRLFAEGARAAFGCTTIAGLPEELRCTASFGVAERYEDEDIAALSIRADQALYEAKEAGRDCVRVALVDRVRHQPLGPREFGLVAGS